MSIGSKLVRGKDGSLMKDGKPFVIELNTGDETLVKVDEREDVDVNRLVLQQAVRGMIPPQPVYADLTELPASRGEAESTLMKIGDRLRRLFVPGDTYETALARVMGEKEEAVRRAMAEKRDLNADKPKPSADSSKEPSKVEPKAS